MPDELSRVTVISVGCWDYQHLLRLKGPQQDIANVRSVLVQDQSLALFAANNYFELLNPTSESLRKVISDYVYSRVVENDILLFYFSGHGTTVGSNDFAFCTVDTKPVEEENAVLPMTAVRFSDVLSTLWLKRIIPIFIVDACYSGAAGGKLNVAASQLVNDLKEEVQKKYAGSYALLCSAPTDEEVVDNYHGVGGFFSHSILQIAQEGIDAVDKRSPTVFLDQVYEPLRHLAEQSAYTPYPMLFLGPTLPKFSIFNNIIFQPLEYRLHPHLVAVLQVLWNDGHIQALRPREILQQTGMNGAYGNHRKLSFAPWSLVETINGSQRALTERGREFMHGNLAVPRDIIFDINTNDYIAKPGSGNVTINDFANMG